MKSAILLATLLALSFAAMAGAEDVQQAQEVSGDTPEKIEKSKNLIKFEASFDEIEQGFVADVKKGGTEEFKAKLKSFEELGTELQDEADKAELSKWVTVKAEIAAISTAYSDYAKASADGKTLKLPPSLIDTRRRGCQSRPGAWERVRVSQEVLDDFDKSYSDANDGVSKVSLPELLNAFLNIRQEIVWMEKDGHWEVLPNNGKTYRIEKLGSHIDTRSKIEW